MTVWRMSVVLLLLTANFAAAEPRGRHSQLTKVWGFAGSDVQGIWLLRASIQEQAKQGGFGPAQTIFNGPVDLSTNTKQFTSLTVGNLTDITVGIQGSPGSTVTVDTGPQNNLGSAQTGLVTTGGTPTVTIKPILNGGAKVSSSSPPNGFCGICR